MNLQAPTWTPTQTTADPSFQSGQVRSKIVLSFAMKGGGDPFIRWLHNKLMERCALSKKSIYADHILAPFMAREPVPFAEREVVGPFQREVEAALNPGLPSGIYGRTVASLPAQMPNMTIRPDLREEMRRPDGTYPYAGIQRDDWEVLFESAVRSAQVAILVLNDQYMKSDYCKAEVRMIRNENEQRRDEGRRPPLRIVAVRVRRGMGNTTDSAGEIDQMVRAAMGGATVLSVTPIAPPAGTPNASQISWVVSDGDLGRIVGAIGRLTA